jgi:hypothetical protein
VIEATRCRCGCGIDDTGFLGEGWVYIYILNEDYFSAYTSRLCGRVLAVSGRAGHQDLFCDVSHSMTVPPASSRSPFSSSIVGEYAAYRLI